MVLWILYENTLEVPDSLYRQIKARAALKGQTIRAYFLDAIQDKLRAERDSGKKTTGWRSVFGKATPDSQDPHFDHVDKVRRVGW